MGHLITPSELPDWVPGKIICASDHLGWRGVTLRGYRYLGQDVYIPPMRDYMIVSYRRGLTPMERRFEGAWQQTRCAPGSISLLTREQRSNWNWSENVDVFHVYLTEELLGRLASEALGHAMAGIRLNDVLNVEDPVLTAGVEAIQREAREAAFGGHLYVEAVAAQLGLHLLRHYAELALRERPDTSRLSPALCARLTDYIEGHLHESLELQALASVAGLGVCSFSRRFRASFGCAPYAYVLTRRLERAQRLLADPGVALKQIAADCGFADQAHMTRVFKTRLGVTPGALRTERLR
jgi:AraC family transcriptional regulator